MNFKRYHVSRNLFDYSTIETGHRIQWTTGNDYVDTTAIMSDFIPVELGWYALSTSASIVGYSSDKSYVGVYRTDIKTWEKRKVGDTTNFEIINGSNIAYVKIMTYGEMPSISSVTMLNKGTNLLPYEPYSSEVWHDIPYYQHKTATDTITTLPAVLYPNGTTATVGLKGQTLQSSVPSPTSPIMPQGTGERTGNLWDESYTNISTTLIYKSFYVGDGIFTASTDCPISYPSGSSSLFFIAGNVSTGASSENNLYNNRPRTVESINGYVTIAYRITGSVNPNDYNTMINSGSTALPYEPFGYKIPISSANTTTPVYLGEVETTRKIKKLVLDGTEPWVIKGVGATIRYENSPILSSLNSICYCSHFKNTPLSEMPSTDNAFVISYTSAPNTINIRCTNYSTVDDFKAFLATQYANGTPVTIWYVLATPTTGIVNEPLRKIGDYADEVSGITIPTIAGANTISIGTTLQPSEVTVNYKGWHPVADVHEAENGAWT